MDSLYSPRLSSKAQLTVYWIPNTEAAARLRQYLVGKGVSFNERDVTTSAAYAQEMMNLSGQNTSPVIVSGERKWVGWDKSVEASLQTALRL